MGEMRKLQRSVAKGRIKAMGAGNVNKKMNVTGVGVSRTEPLWKRVLFGDLAKQGFAAQMGQKIRRSRKLRKVSK